MHNVKTNSSSFFSWLKLAQHLLKGIIPLPDIYQVWYGYSDFTFQLHPLTEKLLIKKNVCATKIIAVSSFQKRALNSKYLHVN